MAVTTDGAHGLCFRSSTDGISPHWGELDGRYFRCRIVTFAGVLLMALVRPMPFSADHQTIIALA
jgi:hypothetical protein